MYTIDGNVTPVISPANGSYDVNTSGSQSNWIRDWLSKNFGWFGSASTNASDPNAISHIFEDHRNDPMSSDSGALSGWQNVNFNDPDAVMNFANQIMNDHPDMAQIYLNYALSEKSNLSSYNRSLEASNTQYQRMVEDLRKAGLNPWTALSGLSSSGVSSGSTSYGNNSIVDLINTKSTNARSQKTAQIAALAMLLVGLMKVIF